MNDQTFKLTEVVNRLRKATTERRILWERTGLYGPEYSAALENGSHARLACVSATEGGSSTVHLSLTDANARETLHLDSDRISQDLLRLALLQLYIAARDSIVDRAADAALDSVRNL
jgi:hypothetical protein